MHTKYIFREMLSGIGSVSHQTRNWLCFARDLGSAGKLPSKIGSVRYFRPKQTSDPEGYILTIKRLDNLTLRFYDNHRRTDTNYVTYSF
jgi:hypothetical protein